MISAHCERAIADAMKYGRALFKFISRNDAGVTGSHQCGFYLPKHAWEIYANFPPTPGTNLDASPTITWHDGRVTESRVVWYGQGTRSEYRLTRFGREFPFLCADTVGDLFVLIPKSHTEFLAYVLDSEEDIDEIQATLGVEIIETWGIFRAGKHPVPESETACITRQFGEFAAQLSEWPSTKVISEETRRVIQACISDFDRQSPDEQLMRCVTEEYTLFRTVERKLTEPFVMRSFSDVDDFLATAQTILQRRKSRAGKSLEHHVAWLLQGAGVPFTPQPQIDGKVQPDILIPSKEAYEDASYPSDRLYLLALKTTCKDRWRQVLNEGKRIPIKHILTFQPTISEHQLDEMSEAGVVLVVPKELHKGYPDDRQQQILSVEQFIELVRPKAE